jgi:predicted metal-dependent HD superfamily phosphohydrolase
MGVQTDLLEKAIAHVKAVLERDHQPWAAYHGIDHTLETAENCKEIAGALQFDPESLDILLFAAWFHDIGYVEGVDGHERRSMERAEAFLRKEGCPEEFTRRVVSAIRATKIPQDPRDIVDAALCDADVMHLGKESFFSRSALLRQEMENRENRRYTEVEWYRYNINFVSAHAFHTGYARETLEKQHAENLRILRAKLAEATKAGR